MSALGTSCSENDTVTVVNVALPGVVFFVEQNPVLAPHSEILLRALNVLISSSQFRDELFHNVTIREFLFEGYSSGRQLFNIVLPLIWTLTRSHCAVFTGTLDALSTILPPMIHNITGKDPSDLDLPVLIQGGKFAVFNGRNGTADNYVVNSGRYDMSQYTK